MAKVPSEEELSRMTPDERIRILKELAESRKKELETTRMQVEEELKAAEALISRSEGEKDEEEQAIEEARERLRELQRGEESLEERLLTEQVTSSPEESGRQYNQPSNLYQTLPDAISELERLYGRRNWSDDDVRNYNEAKEQVQRVQQYDLSSDRLAEELGLGVSVLNKLKYRH